MNIRRKDPNSSIWFQFSPNYQVSGILGCHSAALYGLNLPTISIQQGDKKDLNKYPYSQVTGDMPMGPLYNVANKLLDEDDTIREEIFEQMRQSHGMYSVVIMSGNCHSEKTPFQTGHIWGKWSVAAFASWLRSKGEAILASPIMTNGNHIYSAGQQSTNPVTGKEVYGEGFSLLRTWMWMPNGRTTVYHIKDTEYTENLHSRPNIVPLEEWRTKYPNLPKFDLAELNG